MTRSTFRLFDCEGQLPTVNYDLEQAVDDEWLTPFEVFEHTTQFLREGITLDSLTKEQIEELEECRTRPYPGRFPHKANGIRQRNTGHDTSLNLQK